MCNRLTGPVGARVRPSCEPWLAAGSANHVQVVLSTDSAAVLSKRYRVYLKPDFACLTKFRKIEALAKTNHSYGKVTGNSLGGPESSVGKDLRESPGWCKQSEPNRWNLRYGRLPASSMALWGKDSEKEQWPLLALLSGRKLTPALALMVDNSVPLHMSLMLFKLLPPC